MGEDCFYWGRSGFRVVLRGLVDSVRLGWFLGYVCWFFLGGLKVVLGWMVVVIRIWKREEEIREIKEINIPV